MQCSSRNRTHDGMKTADYGGDKVEKIKRNIIRQMLFMSMLILFACANLGIRACGFRILVWFIALWLYRDFVDNRYLYVNFNLLQEYKIDDVRPMPIVSLVAFGAICHYGTWLVHMTYFPFVVSSYCAVSMTSRSNGTWLVHMIHRPLPFFFWTLQVIVHTIAQSKHV